VAVLFHAWYGDIQAASVLYEWEKLLPEIFWITAEIMIGTGADDRIEEFLCKGENWKNPLKV